MGPVTIPKRAANIGIFAFFILFAAAAYSRTGTFPSPLLPGYPGSAMFPRLVLIAMGAICIIGLARSFLSPRGATEQGVIVIPFAPVVGVVALLLGFALVLLVAGMEIAVFTVIAGCLWARTRRPFVAAASGVAAVVVVYFVFVQALSVHLPLLFLPRYLFLGS